ncbi:hypothetical protein F4694_001211 [Bacillus niacini]|uniref:Uncharacterized protein n=1 Tax=Neobacillus niacini TaxID=86668 RepID=A0A852T9K6_9BACI|nr:hypothetical protein [Neobacillus niacini]
MGATKEVRVIWRNKAGSLGDALGNITDGPLNWGGSTKNYAG